MCEKLDSLTTNICTLLIFPPQFGFPHFRGDIDAGEKELTWSAFTQGANLKNKASIRSKYTEFLKSVQAIGEDSMASAEIAQTAYAVLRAVEYHKRAELEKLTGKIDNGLYATLEKQAAVLIEWRAANTGVPSENRTRGKDGGDEEFGSSLEYCDPFIFKDTMDDIDPETKPVREEKDAYEQFGDVYKDIDSKRKDRFPVRKDAAVDSSNDFDWDWLVRKCEKLATFSSTGEALIKETDLAQKVLLEVQSNKTENELQMPLLELLGYESFDLIAEILAARSPLRSVKPFSSRKAISGPQQMTSESSERSAQVPRNLVGVSISSSKHIEWDKQKKKQERRMFRKSDRRGAGQANDTAIDEAKLDEQANLLRNWKKDTATGPKGKGGLPPGAVQTYHKDKGYTEVYVPPVIPPPLEESELVPVTELDDFAQLAMKGTKRLNRIQSKVFEAAYKRNDNLLVCAPTGAGKTNCAMLTILHEVGQHIVDGVLDKDMFKIVYVAPMKALAQEVQEKFQKKLAPLGIVVKELTGDMQLTKAEIQNTQMIVTTPEKWDVMTRKSGDGSLMDLVRLLILDEVHLLHEERGPVIEILVARTLRMVETSQKMCRIVGLSATLPNYQDVAVFLGVNPKVGLFHFDNSYRPVPLTQYYIGVQENNMVRRRAKMNTIAYEKCVKSLREGYQVMVFVHSRKDTAATAKFIKELAHENNNNDLFETMSTSYKVMEQKVAHSKNRDVKELFPSGLGIHHAGMTRPDRSLTEKMFAEGVIKVLVCTATLAWGVNLPAHTVIIKGTQIYDPKRGGWVDVGMLDVMQIFGRAGRPQFDTTGEGIIITAQSSLQHYLSLLNHQMPIESQFTEALADHLNAEIILGTVTNFREAVQWLSYTYLYTRMLRNPMVYGITYEEKAMDPLMHGKRDALIREAAKTLMACRMVKCDLSSGNFYSTDVGRVASHYYIHHESVRKYNEIMKPHMNHEEIMAMLAQSQEFEQIRLRDEEIPDLEKLAKKYCPVPIRGKDSAVGKVNILLQTYISRGQVDNPNLISDSYYVTQSAGRICRALFEIMLKKGRPVLAAQLLDFCKMFDKRVWNFQHPLRQFSTIKEDVLGKLEAAKGHGKLDSLLDMEPGEIGILIKHRTLGKEVLKYANEIPWIDIAASVQPITRAVLQVELKIKGNFKWNDRFHGNVEPFWIWVEDAENEHIYHTEYFLLHKKKRAEEHKLAFTIPIFEPLPPQYYVRAASDRWLGSDNTITMSFKHLILPELHPPHTTLLDLTPIPITALHNAQAEQMYKYSHFNPVQTQAFHTLYHTNENILLGAPTGSGKTVIAELAMLRLFALYPKSKVVYIAPMKALARERMDGWNSPGSFKGKMGKSIIELTGDTTPDGQTLKKADVLITTPEKWDGVSRSWQARGYVQAVGLVIIDEIHLLGQDRGPILEVIVSRMRYISQHTEHDVRIVGLSTALANARDLADWLGIDGPGLFNFHPVVRPVPLEVHIAGFPGRHYCPRMATMNKPCYAAITSHSPNKPVLVFVSSRRQTRLTALDLIQFSSADGNPRKFLHMSNEELEYYIASVRDPNLKHMLAFGIGMHHAGLPARDRSIVEELFVKLKIQVLVCTATLAWGVNFPAHLVVVKGTEYYDAKVSRYVDFPVTDVLQMMGRAGRPQFDDTGKAVILVHQPKKNFYMNFLHSPFPVESSLLSCLHDHLNAEVVGGTIASLQDAIDYLTWTFFFRRLIVNPSFYNLEDTSPEGINSFLLNLVQNTLSDLQDAGCLVIEDDDSVYALSLGQIASYYYLKHSTIQMFSNKLQDSMDLQGLLDVLSSASEYEELPVRHNEDKINEELAEKVRWEVDLYSLDSPFTKANILFQAHFQQLELPISDYYTDTKSVLDQAVRILQAMVDVCAEAGWLDVTMKVMLLTQMVAQGRYATDNTLLGLPHVTQRMLSVCWREGITCLPELMALETPKVLQLCRKGGLSDRHSKDLCEALGKHPSVDVKVQVNQYEALYGGEDCQVNVLLMKQAGSSMAYSPRFNKPKKEGWWLMLGMDGSGERLEAQEHPSGSPVVSEVNGELLALKRVMLSRGKNNQDLTFQLPAEPGSYDFTIYLVSDSYLGLDQQYSFSIIVQEGERQGGAVGEERDEGEYYEGDGGEGVEDWAQRGEQGEGEGQYAVGEQYETGEGEAYRDH